MITNEELSEKYAQLTIAQLLNIIDQRNEYTELAVTVALSELGKRNVSEEEIKRIKEADEIEFQQVIEKNFVQGLSFIQKNLFYFVWIPFKTFAFRRNFDEGGYVLKLKQAKYYSFFGFIFFMLAGILGVIFEMNDIGSLVIWISGFVIAAILEARFNRLYLMNKFNREIESKREKD